MTTAAKRKILIVDDHPVFCLGMSELINKAADLCVCGSEDTPAKRFRRSSGCRPTW